MCGKWCVGRTPFLVPSKKKKNTLSLSFVSMISLLLISGFIPKRKEMKRRKRSRLIVISVALNLDLNVGLVF